jgi:hypothetical protein
MIKHLYIYLDHTHLQPVYLFGHEISTIKSHESTDPHMTFTFTPIITISTTMSHQILSSSPNNDASFQVWKYEKKSPAEILDLTPRPDHYAYSAPIGDDVTGKSFQVDTSILDTMGFPIPQSRMVFLTSASVKDFVVVTAASGQFFHGLLKALFTVQHKFPGQAIIVYDLGLEAGQVEQVGPNAMMFL